MTLCKGRVHKVTDCPVPYSRYKLRVLNTVDRTHRDEIPKSEKSLISGKIKRQCVPFLRQITHYIFKQRRRNLIVNKYLLR